MGDDQVPVKRWLGGLPGLADGARREPLLAGIGDVLEVGALGLRDPRDPGAVALVEEARGPLSAVRLTWLDGDGRRGLGCGRRGLGLGRQHGDWRWLDGGRRRRNDRGGLVDVEGRLDGRTGLVTRPAELAYRATDHPSQLGKLTLARH